MQQTVDVIAKEAEDLLAETILVSGLSYFFYAVADAVLIAVDSDVAMTAAYGSSSCYSSVADLEATEAETTADVAATICAANC